MKMDYFCSNKQSTILLSSIFLSVFWLGDGNLYTAIQWNPLNPLFKTSNDTKNALQINVTMKSQMNIICPNVATNLIYLRNSIGKEYLYENLWFVDKQSFDSCSADTSRKNNRLLFKCDDPVNLKYKVLTFKSISPIKGEPEFEQGKEYYFIATSNGTSASLDNKHQGHCKTHNMRLRVYICVDKNDPHCNAHTVQKSIIAEPKTTAPSPTQNNKNDQIDFQEKPKHREGTQECFMTTKDKIWLIALGVILGIVLMLLLACLVFTCYKKRRSQTSKQDGKVPLNDRYTDPNGV